MRGWLVLMVLAGCVPKAHPLQDQRDLLAQQEREPLPRGWAPEAAIVVGEPLSDRLLDRGLDQAMAAIPKSIDVPVPLIGSVKVTPRLDRPVVSLVDGACAGCLRADVSWKGTLALGRPDKAQGGVPWSAETSTTLRLAAAEGREIRLSVAKDAPQEVAVDIKGLPPGYQRGVDLVIGQILTQEIDEGVLSKPVTVFALPEDAPARLRDLRVDVDPGVRVDVAFAALHRGPVGALPDPGDGWVAVVPEGTLLGLLHAAALREEPVRGYAPEPVALTVDDGAFRLRIRLHKAGRKERWRELEVRGTIGLGPEGRVRLHATDAEEVAKQGSFGLSGAIVRSRVLAFFDGGRTLSLPGRQDLKVGEETWTLAVDRVEADDGQLALFGSLKLGSPTALRRERAP